MKLIKLLIGIVLILIALQSFLYFNLNVSHKYEVDLMETHIEVDSSISEKNKLLRIEKLRKREVELHKQMKINKISLLVLSLSLITLFILYNKRKRPNNEQEDRESLEPKT